MASIYIVLSIAVERFLAVCRPHQYREMQVQSNLVHKLLIILQYFQGRKNRSLHYILPVLVFSFLINVPKWMEIETREWKACYDYSACFGTTFVFEENK